MTIAPIQLRKQSTLLNPTLSQAFPVCPLTSLCISGTNSSHMPPQPSISFVHQTQSKNFRVCATARHFWLRQNTTSFTWLSFTDLQVSTTLRNMERKMNRWLVCRSSTQPLVMSQNLHPKHKVRTHLQNRQFLPPQLRSPVHITTWWCHTCCWFSWKSTPRTPTHIAFHCTRGCPIPSHPTIKHFLSYDLQENKH